MRIMIKARTGRLARRENGNRDRRGTLKRRIELDISNGETAVLPSQGIIESSYIYPANLGVPSMFRTLSFGLAISRSLQHGERS